MTLPASSNSISYSQIQQEFGGSVTNITLQNYYRINTSADVNSTSNVANIANNSTIKQYNSANLTMDMNQWWNTKKGFTYNVAYASSTTNYNLYASAVTAGWNKSDPLDATVVVRSGVYMYSTSTGTYAFDSAGAAGTTGSYPAGSLLRIHNFGVISGQGGPGGPGTYGTPGNAGTAAGPAFLVSCPIYVNNTGTIGGGGGGGGGGRGDAGTDGGEGTASYGGGGGGGGAGYSGGSGGGGQGGMSYNGSPGAGGSWNAGGGGGGGGGGPAGSAGPGGAGGTSGNAGATGGNSFASGSGGPGGAAGACISGNSSITWGQIGTRYGAIT